MSDESFQFRTPKVRLTREGHGHVGESGLRRRLEASLGDVPMSVAVTEAHETEAVCGCDCECCLDSCDVEESPYTEFVVSALLVAGSDEDAETDLRHAAEQAIGYRKKKARGEAPLVTREGQ